MRSQVSPHLEPLEDRLVPAVFGIPWTDAGNLTLSFVADGTTVGAAQSSLVAHLDSLMAREVWQGEILRAVQTWLSVTNIDITVIEDQGQALGTAGQVQGDGRFGDIRIAGISLGTNSLSSASPYDPSLGTWSGDILINTDVLFSANGLPDTVDLYSVVLHELGHVFGVEGNLTDPTSVLFEYYNGTRPGLNGGDITAIQSLYGARKGDRFEGALGNDTVANATNFMTASRREYRQALRALETVDEAANIERLVVRGDLTSATDLDYFWYDARGRNPGFSLTLSTTEDSLLRARLRVFDQYDNLLGTGTTSATGEVTLSFTGLAPDGIYRFRVESADPNFAVGAYTLRMTPNNANVAARLDGIYNTWVTTVTDNGTIATATAMKRAEQSVPGRPTFFANGNISFVGDIDVYKVTAPRNGALMRTTLTAGSTAALPTLSLRDAAGNDVAFQVVVNSQGMIVIEASNLARGDYFLTVADSNPFDYFGDYRLWTQFKLPADSATPVFEDSLDEFNYQQFRGMTLTTTQLLDLQFTAGGTTNASMQVLVYDNAGNVVLNKTISSGSTQRFQVLLGPGQYNFRFTGGHADGAVFSLDFNMTARVASDPIGPQIIDPSAPPPRATAPQWAETAFTILSALLDPYGRSYSEYIRWY